MKTQIYAIVKTNEGLKKLFAGDKEYKSIFEAWNDMWLDGQMVSVENIFARSFSRANNCVRKYHASGGWHDEIIHKVLCFGVLAERGRQ